METKSLEAATIEARTALNNMNRRFQVTEEIVENFSKTYHRVDNDIRLLRFAQDSNGTLSDAFILYAIAMLGVTDRDSVQLFLNALKTSTKELSIYDTSNDDAYRSRLKMLMENGFLFRHKYSRTVTNPYTNLPSTHEVSLYTIEQGALTFMNQKLGTRVKGNDWICAKPIEELMGWASCSYAISKMANNDSFCKFKPGIFRSKSLGVVKLPCELKTMVGNDAFYVSTIPAFFHRNVSRQSKDAYMEECLYKINVIKNYFYVRATQEKSPFMVVVCENVADMEEMVRLIVDSEVLLNYTERIYFTGEGLLALSDNLKNCFLQMVKTKTGYSLVSSQPVFLK